MKLAIIDAGTRATRMLIGDTEEFVRDGFHFDLFRNEGWPTHMGDWLKSHSDVFPLEATDEVVARLLQFHKIARRQGVQQCIALGTAVWRLAANREELCRHIYERTGIILQVLRKEDEAEFAFLAALLSCQRYYQPGDGVLFIDQGGGSTEVVCGEYTPEGGARFHGLESLDLGTILLRNRFTADVSRLDRAAYEEIRDQSIRLIETHDFAASMTPVMGRLRTCLAVGSVVGYATRMSRNRDQHGKRLAVDFLESDCRRVVEKFLHEAAQRKDKDAISSEALEHDLDMMCGLPVYAAILRRFRLPELIVCGCGLRYGVFFARAINHPLQMESFRWPN
jgi:exopolyphosphatase/pppGpp-phosphohydrolase